MRSGTAWLLAASLLVGPPSAADEQPGAIKGAVGAPQGDSIGSVGGDLSYEMLDGDSFLTINLGLNFDLGKIGFGIQAPLRLKVDDSAPQQDDYGGVLRKEDWDEWTDYLKILRFFRYGRKGELIFVQVGDLPGATVGHGTIVNRYYNNTDLDHYRMGIQLDVNTDYGGVETLLNNGFISNLIGARGYIRPWSFVDPESYMNNLALGFSVVTDWDAPYCIEGERIQTGTRTGECLPDDPGPELAPSFDSDGNLRVERAKAATALGGDIEFRVLNLSWLSLTPYIDFNGLIDGGWGLHAGIMSVFHIPVINLDLSARAEYRYFAADYIPAYFDSYYEIQKFSYPFKDDSGRFGGGEQARPKRRVLEELGAQFDGGLNGYYAELVFDLMGWVQLGASYDDYDGPYNSNLRLYLAVPALEVVQFGAYYYRHNFEGAANAFAFDDKSLFLAEARYHFWSVLYLVGQYWRVWQLETDPSANRYGEYVPVDDWSIGIGAAYTF